MVALEVMVTMSCSKKWLRQAEKDYETITWLCCVVEKTPEHCIVTSKSYCAVYQNYEYTIHRVKYFLCATITGLGNKKLAMS